MSNDGLARQRADQMVDRLTAYVETLQPNYERR
jgi:hypothetical protein